MKQFYLCTAWVGDNESSTLGRIAEAKADPSVCAIKVRGRPPFEDDESQPSKLELELVDLVRSRRWESLTFDCGNETLITQFMTRIAVHGEFESIEIYDSGYSIGGYLGIRIWRDRAFQSMLDYCITRQRKLRTFRMIFSRLTKSQVRLLANALSSGTSLEEVYFSRCEFPALSARMIAESLLVQNKVRKLTTAGSSFTDEDLAEFLRTLQDLTQLQHLNIQGNCSLHREGDGTKGMDALGGLLGQNRLKSLELSVTVVRPEGSLALANALSRNTSSLVSLAINGSTSEFTKGLSRRGARDAERTLRNQVGLNDASLKVLLPALFHEEKQWTSFDLTTNRLSDEGIQQLLDRLPEAAPHLEVLNIRKGSYGVQGQENIIEFVCRSCLELRQVEMDGLDGRTERTKREKLEYYLRLNRGGRRIWKSKKNVPLGVWSCALARVNSISSWSVPERADVIFHLLKGPVLFNHPNLPKASA